MYGEEVDSGSDILPAVNQHKASYLLSAPHKPHLLVVSAFTLIAKILTSSPLMRLFLLTAFCSV